ncbi:TniB family NTP-binding protein [Methylotenera sp. G11]|uniref:TniB family NTP-binding protein n=1 Tax=Methylotenera sp. G11 TaxID=1506585 RepID=UPI000646EE95|nr:TniB family NTP-binding protein [Methylotenera sp. G11]
MNQIQYIPTAVDQVLVPHRDFQRAKLRIETHLLATKSYSEPTCIAVVGESRTGKSRLLESISRQHPKQRDTEGAIVPILSVRTPSKPSVKGLVEVMLRELGDPLWYKRGSENEKTERLYTLLTQTRTNAIIIDEFQHFYDKVSHKVQHYLSDWLKIFVDRSGLMLIVAGLPDCMAVINQNQQLRGRFMAPIHMPRFDWNDEDAQAEFIACLESFQQALSRYELPDLTSDEMAFRFYCATGGLIGYLAKILHQACLSAQVNNTFSISLADLARAYEESVWMDGVVFIQNPFGEDFDTTPSLYSVEAAQQVGAASHGDAESCSQMYKAQAGMTAGEVLTK